MRSISGTLRMLLLAAIPASMAIGVPQQPQADRIDTAPDRGADLSRWDK